MILQRLPAIFLAKVQNVSVTESYFGVLYQKTFHAQHRFKIVYVVWSCNFCISSLHQQTDQRFFPFAFSMYDHFLYTSIGFQLPHFCWASLIPPDPDPIHQVFHTKSSRHGQHVYFPSQRMMQSYRLHKCATICPSSLKIAVQCPMRKDSFSRSPERSVGHLWHVVES